MVVVRNKVVDGGAGVQHIDFKMRGAVELEKEKGMRELPVAVQSFVEYRHSLHGPASHHAGLLSQGLSDQGQSGLCPCQAIPSVGDESRGGTLDEGRLQRLAGRFMLMDELADKAHREVEGDLSGDETRIVPLSMGGSRANQKDDNEDPN